MFYQNIEDFPGSVKVCYYVLAEYSKEVKNLNMIKHFRKQRRITVYELAMRTDLTASYISNLENGIRTNPSKEAMEKIAAALEKSVPEVFFPNKQVRNAGKQC